MVSFGNMNSDWYTANGIHLHLRIENLTRRCHITCFEAVLQIIAFFISTLILILKEDCKFLSILMLVTLTIKKIGKFSGVAQNPGLEKMEIFLGARGNPMFSRFVPWMVRCISPYINCRLSSSISLFQLFHSISFIDRSNITSFICFCIW